MQKDGSWDAVSNTPAARTDIEALALSTIRYSRGDALQVLFGGTVPPSNIRSIVKQ